VTHSEDGKRVVDQDLIRELAKLLKETELTEIEIEQEGWRVRVARPLLNGALPPSLQAQAAPPAVQPSPAAVTAAEPDLSKHPGAVVSPMVGTVFLAPEPGAAAYVKVGDTIVQGQTLLIVEAMKTMNQIPAPRAGRVARILVQNGQAVEYGEPLVIVE
jgi:acetyl-CoA carboxylase biotin carboxyl carrier protein